jgi:hypothetical protein
MSWFEELRKSIVDSLKSDIQQATLTGLEDDVEILEKGSKEDIVARKAQVVDPYYDNASSSYFLQRGRMSRISNKTLKDVSIRDWLCSSIIQNRVDTFIRFGRPTHDKYKMGYKFVRRDNQQLTKEDREKIEHLEKFIYNCGNTENVPSGDTMNFGEYLKLTVRDALTFGYVGTEKVLTRSGALHRFRPLPAETLYLVNPRNSKEVVESSMQTAMATYNQKKSNNDPKGDGKISPHEIEYFKYVQVSGDGLPLAVFGDEDLVFKLGNPQNFADSNGYCISVVEQAIIMITTHLNIENYNQNFFSHGYAARGILHLKGTVTQNALAAFRRQFYNTISGSQNAWRTPIVSGLEDVQWVPMSGSAKEMEYLNYNSHIMRALCTQFQIDPIELGLDFLTSANGRAASNAKESGQFKITYSRERGLLPLIMLVEDIINDNIIPACDKELADNYKFKFVGYEDDTAQTDVALKQGQMTTFASMNYLLSAEGKDKIEHPAADLPLNQSFWNLCNQMMTKGEIRETFLGDKDASKRPELQYISGDPSFLAWQQMLLSIAAQKKQMDDQKAQQEQQQQQVEHQQQQEKASNSREQEAHDAQMENDKNQKAAAAVNYSQQLQDNAKQFGATAADHIGGKTIKNPLNAPTDDE